MGRRQYVTQALFGGADGGCGQVRNDNHMQKFRRPVEICPKCEFETYLHTEKEVGCVSCGLELGECVRCRNRLMPNDAWFEDSRICSYCDYQESMDNW